MLWPNIQKQQNKKQHFKQEQVLFQNKQLYWIELLKINECKHDCTHQQLGSLYHLKYHTPILSWILNQGVFNHRVPVQ